MSRADRLCGVALAAGSGDRLRPLTLRRPKPLCPVDNEPLLDHALGRLAGITSDLAVNLHHGREAIAAHLDGTTVHRSVEEGDEALGTAGALGRLRPWIDGRAVAVVNADTWCPGSLEPALEGWDGERVRLLLVGGLELGHGSTLAGALLPWSTVAPLEPVPSGLYEVSWGRLAHEGRVDAVAWPGPCFDCGTPGRYLAANMAASGGISVIGKGAVVEGFVERSVVWDGVEVRPEERLVDAIKAANDMTVFVR
ncbi:MAG TPA: sugar phosphate nucleotidyltransferase [Acidimicrobiales bacterium]|nr:sugar phosphate nucleotidyltransferase [Acidimicrobiales bacterium]